ncbi:TVP38/TMEM64 family protein [Actinomycetospora flava]|uniref:TVP38/TMEM64 family membrane protein n=1 Tax=Actinomycetospora flava TaxID=3129232 RepID=A0ABU8LWV4_9PSEU
MAPLRLTSGRGRWYLLAAVLLALVVVAVTVPLPTPLELRDRVAALGGWAPLAFLGVHVVVTTAPVPRTAFSLCAGLLFGPWLGLVLCLVASVASAAAGFAISRRLGGRAVRHLGPGRVRMLEERLSSRGLLAVVSARFVPFIPFAPLNYTFGVTSVRWWHYLVGTAIGLVPGTAAVVLFGDAVTGSLSPGTLVIFLISGSLGLLGVAFCARTPAPES